MKTTFRSNINTKPLKLIKQSQQPWEVDQTFGMHVVESEKLLGIVNYFSPCVAHLKMRVRDFPQTIFGITIVRYCLTMVRYYLGKFVPTWGHLLILDITPFMDVLRFKHGP